MQGAGRLCQGLVRLSERYLAGGSAPVGKRCLNLMGVTHVGEIWWISKIWTLFENRTPKVKSCLTGSQRRNTGLMCCKYSESCHQGSHRHADPFPLGCECMLVAEQRKQLLVQRYVGTGTCNSLSNTASYKGLKDQSTDYCTLLQGVWPKPAQGSWMVTICIAMFFWPQSFKKVK